MVRPRTTQARLPGARRVIGHYRRYAQSVHHATDRGDQPTMCHVLPTLVTPTNARAPQPPTGGKHESRALAGQVLVSGRGHPRTVSQKRTQQETDRTFFRLKWPGQGFKDNWRGQFIRRVCVALESFGGVIKQIPASTPVPTTAQGQDCPGRPGGSTSAGLTARHCAL